ncbi:hypothetical protein [Flavobacterium silvaticum]|uniref:Uncharacterized protein n=1 Tax=Flavobacterium silvaticum TaxID=1852020 RepID=A0A972JFE9_9FLAO|nr:hypothetical protein [Flavobacterium silvaticum]NMH27884.1 hypothetical protein [Flavobacterium silvaticum]
MLESKFTNKIYFLFIPLVLFPINTFVLIWAATQNPDGLDWLLILMAIGMWLPLFLAYQVIKNQIAQISIGNGHIRRKTFFANEEDFRIAEFQCFRTIKIRTKHGLFEHLHIIRNGKRIITISESMHANYSQLKQEIAKHLEYGGEIKFSLFKEIREFFRKEEPQSSLRMK